MEIYVGNVSWGSYEDKEQVTLYVGFEYEKAEHLIKTFEFPKNYNHNTYGYIEVWIDGQFSKHIEIINT